jgi:hypothetical protein
VRPRDVSSRHARRRRRVTSAPVGQAPRLSCALWGRPPAPDIAPPRGCRMRACGIADPTAPPLPGCGCQWSAPAPQWVAPEAAGAAAAPQGARRHPTPGGRHSPPSSRGALPPPPLPPTRAHVCRLSVRRPGQDGVVFGSTGCDGEVLSQGQGPGWLKATNVPPSRLSANCPPFGSAIRMLRGAAAQVTCPNFEIRPAPQIAWRARHAGFVTDSKTTVNLTGKSPRLGPPKSVLPAGSSSPRRRCPPVSKSRSRRSRSRRPDPPRPDAARRRPRVWSQAAGRPPVTATEGGQPERCPFAQPGALHVAAGGVPTHETETSDWEVQAAEAASHEVDDLLHLRTSHGVELLAGALAAASGAGMGSGRGAWRGRRGGSVVIGR